MDSRLKNSMPLLGVFFAFIVSLSVSLPASASPIYVYKRGKAITFSDKPPPSGVEGKIFQASKSGYSTFKTAKFKYFAPSHSRRTISNFNGFHNHASRARLNTSFDQLIKEASYEFGVDKSLIRAVIHAESGFNPRAVSPKGAQGLMQLMPGTARRHGVLKAFEPKENIRGGTKYLAWLIKRFDGNLIKSIAAYNAGEGAVDQYGGIPPYSETQAYVRKVLALKDRYKKLA